MPRQRLTPLPDLSPVDYAVLLVSGAWVVMIPMVYGYRLILSVANILERRPVR